MIKNLIITAAIACAFASPGISSPQNPTITRMGNGLTVIIQEDHATELVGIDVWVKAGSSNETPENNGVSHFIEHLVFGTTNKRQSGDMDREMESLGATLDAHTSRDWAHFNTTVSTRYLPKALDILADAVTNAQFPEQDIERERLVILDEIARKQTDAFGTAKDLLARELYGQHPYALPVEGSSKSVDGITRQMILDYYGKQYIPANMAVVLVGDVDSQQILTEVGKAFQSQAVTPAQQPIKVSISPISAQVNKSIPAPYKLVYLSIGFLGPAGSDYKDVCATDVLMTYFGFGYRSWMVDELKGSLGLAVDVSADFLTQRDAAMISIIAATKPELSDKAKDAIFSRLSQIRDAGIPSGSLDLAKRSLLGQFAFQNETFGGRANSCGFYFAVSDPAFSSEYINCVQSITNEDIMRVARKYMDPNSAVVLSIGPVNQQDESQKTTTGKEASNETGN